MSEKHPSVYLFFLYSWLIFLCWRLIYKLGNLLQRSRCFSGTEHLGKQNVIMKKKKACQSRAKQRDIWVDTKGRRERRPVSWLTCADEAEKSLVTSHSSLKIWIALPYPDPTALES